jgi:prevent-host-death family protein
MEDRMGKTINATEAARSFSDIINSVKYKGESYTIVRGGKPAAVIVPVHAATYGRVLKELPAIIHNLPKLGKDAENFLRDVEEGFKVQPSLPEMTEWE